jgi:cytochrome c553
VSMNRRDCRSTVDQLSGETHLRKSSFVKCYQTKVLQHIQEVFAMKRTMLVVLVILAAASFALAQIGAQPATDVLGAHLNYGRGCAGCHAPHSGAWGNGANKSGKTDAGNIALWGQDAGALYGQTILTGQFDFGLKFPETLPAGLVANGTPDVTGILTCLSCHDGNLAQGAMMKNVVYETLPTSYGTYNSIPTLLGKDGNGAGDYLNDHPVGLAAAVGCGGQYNWDCTITAGGVLQMTGPNSSKFVQNYGFFVSPAAYNNTPVVMCTTCHNQHVMNVVKVTNGVDANGHGSGQPSGYYATMFFVNSPYNPGSGTAGSNQTAQFCRQCHGGEANESNNSTAGTIY